jgi:anthranilate synthase component II
VILLIDNYDSFAHNLARYFRRLGQQVEVLRNDQISADEVRERAYAAIVISPGPCTPTEAGCSLDVIRLCHRETPILGVCLGHQAIGAALGAKIERAPWPVHGRTSQIEHTQSGIFQNVLSPLTVCRYHSLIVSRRDLPPSLEMTAWTSDGVVMAIAHREAPLYGVQFHPEAILTEHGDRLLANFLRLAGLHVPADRVEFVSHERVQNDEVHSPAARHLLTDLVYPIGVVDVMGGGE